MNTENPRINRRARVLGVAAASTFGLLSAVAPGIAGAAVVEPEEWDFPGGPPVCAEGLLGIRIEDPSSGAHNADGVAVQLTVHDDDATGPTFDFVIVSGHLATTVFVKGGPDQNVYAYPAPGVAADQGLHAPVNPNNDKFYGLSHIDLCVDVPDTPDEPDTPGEEEPPATSTTPTTEPVPTTVPQEPVVEVEVEAEVGGEVLDAVNEVVPAPATLPRTGASSPALAAAGMLTLLSGVGAVRAARHT